MFRARELFVFIFKLRHRFAAAAIPLTSMERVEQRFSLSLVKHRLAGKASGMGFRAAEQGGVWAGRRTVCASRKPQREIRAGSGGGADEIPAIQFAIHVNSSRFSWPKAFHSLRTDHVATVWRSTRFLALAPPAVDYRQGAGTSKNLFHRARGVE